MKRKILLYIVSVLLLMGSAGSLVGCGQQQVSADPEVEDPTKGEITVYTALEDEQVTEYLAAFHQKYPDIKVNIVRESTGTITAKLLAEKENPQADLVWGTAASSMLVLDNQGMLEPYAPAGIDRILDKFKSDKAVPTWVGIDAWETAIIVNTVEAKKLGLPEIKSYQDLLKPEFKGHIVMSNPNSSGTGFLTVSGVLQLNEKKQKKAGNTLINFTKILHSMFTQVQNRQKWLQPVKPQLVSASGMQVSARRKKVLLWK